MPGTRRSGAKKMPPNLASGLKRTKEQKASEELERVRGWVKAAVENSDAFIGQWGLDEVSHKRWVYGTSSEPLRSLPP